MEKPGLNPGLLFLRAGSASPPAEKAGALERQVFWKALRSDTALGLEQTAGGFRAVTRLFERKAVTQPFPPPRTISMPVSPGQAGIQGERQTLSQAKPAVRVEGI